MLRSRAETLARWFAVIALITFGGLWSIGAASRPASAQECGALTQQAEAGALSGSMVVGNDTDASAGGYVIADAGSGLGDVDDFVELCFQVVTPGQYVIDGRVLAPSTADDSFLVTVDGGAASIWDVANSASWITDRVSARGGDSPVVYELGVGDHTVRVSQREDGTAIDALSLVLVGPAAEQAPFNGPHVIPGIVEAEDFDLGGPGVAFKDESGDNIGGAAYRETAVDVYDRVLYGPFRSDGYVIGNTRDGEWVEYTVTASAAGNHAFDARIASDFAEPGSLRLDVNGETVATAVMPQTSGWWTFEDIRLGSAALPVGDSVVRITWLETGPDLPKINLDALVISAVDEPNTAGQSAFNGPHVVPGLVEAEDFDLGGPGVAYNDETDDNIGGAAYRETAVDVYDRVLYGPLRSDGYVIGNTRDGEWVEYTVTTSAAGNHAFDARIASALAEPGSLRLDVNGETVATTRMPQTRGWWTFEDIRLGSAALPDGDSVIRITWLETGPDLPKINLDALVISAASGPSPGDQAPFNGPNVVPGVVEAEDFDLGGQGVAYNDTTAENIGGAAYRDTAVDIWETRGADGYTVGHARDGEWLEYTITAPDAGTYGFSARVASDLAEPGSLQLDVNGIVISTTPIARTTGWWNFAVAPLGSADLPAGDSVVRITWRQTGPDLPKINVESLLVGIGDPIAGNAFNGPHNVPGVVEAEDFDFGGQGIAFNDTTATNDGGAYRDSAVDVFQIDGADGFAIGQTRDGEFLQYTVTAESARTYRFDARAASGYAAPGSLRLDINGETVATTAIDGTNGWWNFDDVELGVHPLRVGQSAIRITWVANRGVTPKINLDLLRITDIGPVIDDSRQSAFNGPHVVPGVVEAEDFDNGGQDVAFNHQFEDDNPDNVYRDTAVGLRSADGAVGVAVTSLFRGDWLEYTITTNQPGLYEFSGRLAITGSDGALVRLEVDGAPVAVTPIGAAGIRFVDVNLGTHALEAGESVVRLQFEDRTSFSRGLPDLSFDSFRVAASPTDACEPLDQEAEGGKLIGTASIISNGGASGGAIVRTERTFPVQIPSGVELCFDVAEAGIYRLEWQADGVFDVSVGGGDLEQNSIADVGPRFAVGPKYVTDLYNLAAGQHRVRFIDDKARRSGIDSVRLVRAGVSGDAACGGGKRTIEDARVSGRFELGVDFDQAARSTLSAVVSRTSGGAEALTDNYVEFCATVASGDTYRIDADVFTPTRGKNSFFVTVDGGPPVTFSADVAGTPTTDEAPDYLGSGIRPRGTVSVDDVGVEVASWNLAPGDHLIRFYLRHDGVKLYDIELVPPGERSCTIDGRSVPTRLDQASCDAAADFVNLTASVIEPTLRPFANDPCGWVAGRSSLIGTPLARGVTCDGADESIVALAAVQRGSCDAPSPLPASITALTTLARLDVADTCIDSLPTAFGNLSNLRELDLSDNLLTVDALTALTGEFGNLTSLRLGDNRLRGDITALAPLASAIEAGSLSDDIGGNDCLTTTSAAFVALLDETDFGWHQCDSPPEPDGVVNGFEYAFFEGPPQFSGYPTQEVRPSVPVAAAINDAGTVAGQYVEDDYVLSAPNDRSGFVRAPDGTITTTSWVITALNDRGDIVGVNDDDNDNYSPYRTFPRLQLVDGTDVPIDSSEFRGDGFKGFTTSSLALNNGGLVAGRLNGVDQLGGPFLRLTDGTMVRIDVPGGERQTVEAINDLGEVAGIYRTVADEAWFIYIRHADGSFTSIAAPVGATGWDIRVVALNETGELAGRYRIDGGGQWYSFIVGGDGALMAIEVPDGTNTQVFDMNDRGDLVGQYVDADGETRSFLRTADDTFSVIDAGTGGTFEATAINNVGQIAGTAGRLGFVATPG